MYQNMFNFLAHSMRAHSQIAFELPTGTSDKFTMKFRDESMDVSYDPAEDIVFFMTPPNGTPSGYFHIKRCQGDLVKFFPNERLGSPVQPPMNHVEVAV